MWQINPLVSHYVGAHPPKTPVIIHRRHGKVPHREEIQYKGYRGNEMGTITTAFYYAILSGILYGIAKILSKYQEHQWIKMAASAIGIIILFLFL